jgi:hypothetical protein
MFIDTGRTLALRCGHGGGPGEDGGAQNPRLPAKHRHCVTRCDIDAGVRQRGSRSRCPTGSSPDNLCERDVTELEHFSGRERDADAERDRSNEHRGHLERESSERRKRDCRHDHVERNLYGARELAAAGKRDDHCDERGGDECQRKRDADDRERFHGSRFRPCVGKFRHIRNLPGGVHARGGIYAELRRRVESLGARLHGRCVWPDRAEQRGLDAIAGGNLHSADDCAFA